MLDTISNLAKAYVGESQARNRYTFYASIARKEGYNQIAEIFEETAKNEKEHAKVLFELLKDLTDKEKIDMDELEIEAVVPIKIGDTATNLQAAIDGEKYENEIMYPEFAEVAEKEGLKRIAIKLQRIGEVEVHHQERYETLLDQVKKGTSYKKEQKVLWICSECGYVYEGKEAPKKCPLCDHSQKYFSLLSDEVY